MKIYKYIPLLTVPIGSYRGYNWRKQQNRIEKINYDKKIFKKSDYFIDIVGGALVNTLAFPLSIYRNINRVKIYYKDDKEQMKKSWFNDII